MSISYIVENRLSKIDKSHVINPLVRDLNSQLKTYCEQNDKAYFIDLRNSLSEHQPYITRSNLAQDGLQYSNIGLLTVVHILIAQVKEL